MMRYVYLLSICFFQRRTAKQCKAFEISYICTTTCFKRHITRDVAVRNILLQLASCEQHI